jgi:hypothetical protein
MRDYEATISSRPHMERAGVERLAQLMGKAQVYMEYGAGASTMLAGEIGIPIVISTESDRIYCDQVRSQFSPAYLRSVLISLHADIGPTKDWGHPVDRQGKDRWPLYPLKGWRFAVEHGYQPDMVLIDGRFRTACTLACLLFARVEVPILVDDYVGRDYAATLESIMKPSAMHGRMAEFVVPKHRDALLGPIVRALSSAFDDPN